MDKVEEELMREYRGQMKAIDDLLTGDTESHHLKADELLLQVIYDAGFDEVIDWYRGVPKWYA